MAAASNNVASTARRRVRLKVEQQSADGVNNLPLMIESQYFGLLSNESTSPASEPMGSLVDPPSLSSGPS